MNDVTTKIIEIYGSEEHHAKVTSASQVPTSYESITPEWLTDVLCKDVAGAKVAALRLDAPDDGSTNRRRIFVDYNDAGTQAGLPRSVFCKSTAALETRLVSAMSRAALSEVSFYTKVRPLLKMEAPTPLFAAYDHDNHASIIMMRDLQGEVTFCNERTPMDWDRLVSQMDTLADLHAPFHGSPLLGTDAIPFQTWADWWRNMMTICPDFEVYCDKAFGDSEAWMSPELYRRRGEVWKATMASAERHRDLPQTIIHCDVHLKNWYCTNAGKMGVSDFQCITLGHWSRDLIYTLTTALTIEDRRKWEKDLVLYYIERMAEHGVRGITADEAWANMRQQLMTVLAFWTITLRPAPGMPDMQPEATTSEFLRRIYAAMEDHGSLDSF